MARIPDLSIIIVDYKTTQASKKLAESLEDAHTEVIVVDNNSVNRGYGGGLNYGVSRSQGEYLLFLNPDVEIKRKDVQTLLAFLQTYEDVVAVGPQFVDTKGSVVLSSLGDLSFLGSVVGLSFLHGLFPHNQFSKKFWLEGWDRKSTRDVSVINGACMMVRRSDLESVGGFDESFFLYWEENDLCNRLEALGKRIVFLSTISVQHTREVSMRQSTDDLSSLFIKSRSIYLHKHFGLLCGTLVDFWLMCTDSWRELLLFLVALFFRVRALDTISIIDDVRRDYGQAALMLQGKGIPLLGIPSSVPRFSQGPLNIWFVALAFKLGGITPTSPVILSGICTSLTVVLLFVLLKKHVGRNSAFLVSLLLALSPAAISQSRMPFYLFAIPLFVLFFLTILLKLQTKKRSIVFLSVSSFCLLFQWELATIPFAAVLALAFYRNRLRVLSFWKEILLAVVLGLSPQLLFDATHKCQQLCQFVIWMGYRTVAVTGIDGRHRLTVFSSEFWTRVTVQLQQVVGGGAIGLGVEIVLIACGIVLSLKRKHLTPLFVYSLFASLFLFVGLIIHGEPSEAYFPPFLILIPILLGFSLKEIWQRMYEKKDR